MLFVLVKLVMFQIYFYFNMIKDFLEIIELQELDIAHVILRQTQVLGVMKLE